VVRLLAALIGFSIGYVWVRRRAVATFRRRLRRQGVPAAEAAVLASDYREAFRLSALASRIGRHNSRPADGS